MICPICDEGELQPDKIHFIYHNIDFGEFDAEVCNKCGEAFLFEESSKEIENIAIQFGVWGGKTPPQRLDTVSTPDSIKIPLVELFQKPDIHPFSDYQFMPI